MVFQHPRRVVCLSAESADWLARIGAWDQVVGVTAFFDPPVDVPRKPRISGFSTGRLAEIVALEPDLVIGFSDVQAELAARLLQQGLTVLITNQRTITETLDTLAAIARLVGRESESSVWLDRMRDALKPVEAPQTRPRVYFEEWPDPMVTGIAWVGELIERAGGDDIFASRRTGRSARERTVSSAQVVSAAPQLMLASWCGDRVRWDEVRRRPGWDGLPCVRDDRLFELPGRDILQPGYNLVAGYEQICRLVRDCSSVAATRAHDLDCP